MLCSPVKGGPMTDKPKDLFSIYKKLKKEYADQNFAFARVLRFYAEHWDNGVAAKAFLSAWDQRVSEPNELALFYKEKAEKNAKN